MYHGPTGGYQPQHLEPGNVFGPQSKNLASVMRGIKSAVTMQARQIDPAFGWQSRFDERIIRNEQELNAIRVYIISNPINALKEQIDHFAR